MTQRSRRFLTATALVAGALAASAPVAGAQRDSAAWLNAAMHDPRVGLKPGLTNPGVATHGMTLVANRPRPEGFYNPKDPGDFGYLNSDLAFKGHYLFQGNFHGMQIWDIANPAAPVLRLAMTCPGGQGDPSLYGNLLFMSVEETRGRLDCGAQGVKDTVSRERFRGVRIFDVSDIMHPRQVADVQTCRGSHTHTLVVDPKDRANVYIYVSGTAQVRSPNELAGCSGASPDVDPNTSLFRIEVIRVPLAHPERAAVVSTPRIFADSAGHIAGLWRGGAHGEGTQTTTETNMCHDITAYTAVGLAAGACSGNGLLLDISDPVHPKRVAAVADPNFAYWHSATFSNDGSKIVYSDEWGGGMAARCRASDRPQWGADAIFTRTGSTMTLDGYYKLPAVQTEQENCVAHDGMLVPIPGRDIMVQGWYQGGISVFDFTDPKNVKEVAYFDRGPIDSTKLYLGGSWAGYWYNGHIYGSAIARGLDVFDLTPTAELSQNEIDAAKLVHTDLLNPQNQQRIVWPAKIVVAHAYLDQMMREPSTPKAWSSRVASDLDRVDRLNGAAQRREAKRIAEQVEKEAAASGDATRARAIADVLERMGR